MRATFDQEHGEDNWVFVEKDVPWYEDIALGPGPGPLECVSMDSPRADNCVLTDVIADYNTRCSEL